MNVFALTLNIVCLCFSLFLMIMYFSKKNMNNIENAFFRFIIISDFLIVFFELLFPLLCYFVPYNLFLIGLSKRFAYFFMIVFFTFLFDYSTIIAIENNEKLSKFVKNKRKNIFIGITIAMIISCVIEFIIPIKYDFLSNGYVNYAYGPAINDFVEVFSIFLFIFFLPLLFSNWKHLNKKKMLPFMIVLIFESIAIVINIINPTLCTVSLSLTLGTYVMFHTIENPDLKLITELELAKSSAEKANHAKSDFLSSMSHELRTPLNAIVGLTQMIVSNDNVEDIHRDGQDILKASNNLLELVDSILDINKLESNNMEIVEINYDPKEAFDDLIKIMSVRVGEKPIELRTRISPDLPKTLYGDRDKVKRIANNLLTNAIKYTEQGYVELVVDCINVKEVCNLRISVTDTGRGISDDQMEFMFTKFYRKEEDKDSDIEGTGLGLAITKSLVDLMGGKITVNSTVDVGSTFLVTLGQKVVEQKVEENNNETIETL